MRAAARPNADMRRVHTGKLADRTGQHNRRGTVSVGELVADYIAHIDDHLKFVVGKRANLGKPLSAFQALHCRAGFLRQPRPQRSIGKPAQQ